MWLPVFIANEQITHLHISQPEGIIDGIFEGFFERCEKKQKQGGFSPSFFEDRM